MNPLENSVVEDDAGESKPGKGDGDPERALNHALRFYFYTYGVNIEFIIYIRIIDMLPDLIQ